MNYFKIGRKDGLYAEPKKTKSELNCSDLEYEKYLEGYVAGDFIRQGEEMDYEFGEFN